VSYLLLPLSDFSLVAQERLSSATRCKQGKLILIPSFRVDAANAEGTQRVDRSDYKAADKNCKVGDKEQVSTFEVGLRECAGDSNLELRTGAQSFRRSVRAHHLFSDSVSLFLSK
jgi:hypothetical protein